MVEIMNCPHCQTRMMPTREGVCPACRRRIVDSDSPLVVPPATPQDAVPSPVTATITPPDQRKRPLGLSILAGLQLWMTGSYVFVMLRVMSSPELQAAVSANAGPNSMYRTLSPLITFSLMFVTALGYLSQSRLVGFWGGNILAVGSAANVLMYSAMEGFTDSALMLPKLIYPTILFLLLNLRYRDCFR